MAQSEIVMKLDAKELVKDLREEMALVYETAYKAGLQHAQDEGWAYMPGELEQAVLAGNSWLAFQAKVFPNGQA